MLDYYRKISYTTRSLEEIVPAITKQPKQATSYMAHSSYVILLKKNYHTKGSEAARTITEHTLFYEDTLASLRE